MSGSYQSFGMPEVSDSISDSELYGESGVDNASSSSTRLNAPNSSGLLSDNLLAKLMGSRSSNVPLEKMQPDAAFSHSEALNPLKLLDYQYQQTLRSQIEPKKTSSDSMSETRSEIKYVIPQSRPKESKRRTSVSAGDKKVNRLDEELKKFVAKKKSELFTPDQMERSSDYLKRFRLFTQDDYMAPLDSMLDFSSSRYQRDRFFDEVDVGDVYCCTISSINESNICMTLLCHATGKIREIEHLKINAFCSTRDIPELVSGKYRDVSDVYSVKDKVRAVVIGITQTSEKIQTSLLQRDLPRRIENDIQLGGIRFEDLPSSYKTLYDNDEMTYRHMLQSNPLFNSPGAVSRLCAQLNIPSTMKCSLISSVYSLEVSEEEMAISLRTRQSRTQALHNVVKGVKLYKQGEETEALSLYSKALEIDPENVEGLVARGALYANNDSYQRALEDFAKALKLNPNHHNAMDYLLQTLLAYAKDLEEQQDWEGALRCYQQMVTLDPSNVSAKEMVITLTEKVRSEFNQEPTVSSTRPDSASPTYTTQRSVMEQRKSLDRRNVTPPSDHFSDSPPSSRARSRVSRSPTSPAEKRNLSRNVSRSPVRQDRRSGEQKGAPPESGKKSSRRDIHGSPSNGEPIVEATLKKRESQTKETKKTESLDIFDIKEDKKSVSEMPKPPSMFLPYCLATDPVRKKVPFVDKGNKQGLENITVRASDDGRAVLRPSMEQDEKKGPKSASRPHSTSSQSRSRSHSTHSSGSRSQSRSRDHSLSKSRSRDSSYSRSASRDQSTRRRRSSQHRHRRRRSSRSRRKRRRSYSDRRRSHHRSRRSRRSRSRSRHHRHHRSSHRSRDRRSPDRIVCRVVVGGSATESESEKGDNQPLPQSSNTNTSNKPKSKNKKRRNKKTAQKAAAKNTQQNTKAQPQNVPQDAEKVDEDTETTSCVVVTKKAAPVQKPVLGQFKPMRIAQVSLKVATDQLQKAKLEEENRSNKLQDSQQKLVAKPAPKNNDKKLKEMEDFLDMLKKKKDGK